MGASPYEFVGLGAFVLGHRGGARGHGKGTRGPVEGEGHGTSWHPVRTCPLRLRPYISISTEIFGASGHLPTGLGYRRQSELEVAGNPFGAGLELTSRARRDIEKWN